MGSLQASFPAGGSGFKAHRTQHSLHLFCYAHTFSLRLDESRLSLIWAASLASNTRTLCRLLPPDYKLQLPQLSGVVLTPELQLRSMRRREFDLLFIYFSYCLFHCSNNESLWATGGIKQWVSHLEYVGGKKERKQVEGSCLFSPVTSFTADCHRALPRRAVTHFSWSRRWSSPSLMGTSSRTAPECRTRWEQKANAAVRCKSVRVRAKSKGKWF